MELSTVINYSFVQDCIIPIVETNLNLIGADS